MPAWQPLRICALWTAEAVRAIIAARCSSSAAGFQFAKSTEAVE